MGQCASVNIRQRIAEQTNPNAKPKDKMLHKDTYSNDSKYFINQLVYLLTHETHNEPDSTMEALFLCHWHFSSSADLLEAIIERFFISYPAYCAVTFQPLEITPDTETLFVIDPAITPAASPASRPSVPSVSSPTSPASPTTPVSPGASTTSPAPPDAAEVAESPPASPNAPDALASTASVPNVQNSQNSQNTSNVLSRLHSPLSSKGSKGRSDRKERLSESQWRHSVRLPIQQKCIKLLLHWIQFYWSVDFARTRRKPSAASRGASKSNKSPKSPKNANTNNLARKRADVVHDDSGDEKAPSPTPPSFGTSGTTPNAKIANKTSANSGNTMGSEGEEDELDPDLVESMDEFVRELKHLWAKNSKVYDFGQLRNSLHRKQTKLKSKMQKSASNAIMTLANYTGYGDSLRKLRSNESKDASNANNTNKTNNASDSASAASAGSGSTGPVSPKLSENNANPAKDASDVKTSSADALDALEVLQESAPGLDPSHVPSSPNSPNSPNTPNTVSSPNSANNAANSPNAANYAKFLENAIEDLQNMMTRKQLEHDKLQFRRLKRRIKAQKEKTPKTPNAPNSSNKRTTLSAEDALGTNLANAASAAIAGIGDESDWESELSDSESSSAEVNFDLSGLAVTHVYNNIDVQRIGSLGSVGSDDTNASVPSNSPKNGNSNNPNNSNAPDGSNASNAPNASKTASRLSDASEALNAFNASEAANGANGSRRKKRGHRRGNTAMIMNFIKIKNNDNARQYARQLTLRDFHIFRSIHARQFVVKILNKKDTEGYQELTQLIERFEQCHQYVLVSIIGAVSLKKRVEMIDFFIYVAETLLKLNNLYSFMAVCTALNSLSVQKCKIAWGFVNNSNRRKFEQFLAPLCSGSKNFSKLRKYCDKIRPPGIPFLGVVLRDLTYINDGNKNTLKREFDNQINFNKYLRLSDNLAKSVTYLQNASYVRDDPHYNNNVSIGNNVSSPRDGSGFNLVVDKSLQQEIRRDMKLYLVLDDATIRYFTQEAQKMDAKEEQAYRESKGTVDPTKNRTDRAQSRARGSSRLSKENLARRKDGNASKGSRKSSDAGSDGIVRQASEKLRDGLESALNILEDSGVPINQDFVKSILPGQKD